MAEKTYDIIVIGAGPAGLTAALYASRAGKSVLLLEKETFGGQITYSPKVENYPGIPTVSGSQLADMMVEQVLAQDIDAEPLAALGIRDAGYTKYVMTDGGEFQCKSVIIATGSRHRHLGLEREEELVGHGVSYCAVCDGAFYKGRSVAVIGGGNTALQEAVMLSEYCKTVHIIQNLPTLTGETKLIEKLVAKKNVTIIYDTTVKELVGDRELEAIVVEKSTDGTVAKIPLDGIFVAIGQVPENEPFADVVKLSDRGYITAGEDCTTASAGIFTAGDCRTKDIRQVTTATGDGAVAAMAAVKYIESFN